MSDQGDLVPRVEDVAAAKARLTGARATLVARPVADIADVLARVGERFSDPGDSVRREALKELPREAVLSAELAEAVIDGMAVDWTRELISRLLADEFEDPRVLDGADGMNGGRRLMAFGPALCVQISSGSVPGVGVNALIRSLLVKAPTLIKPGAGDVVLTRLFVDVLQDADAELGAAVEVCHWPGSDQELTSVAIEGADLVAAYGSDASVRAVRDLLPVTTRFIPYHHRVGIGLVGREVLHGAVDEVARDVARTVAMFEHRGCVCPHVVFVERGGETLPEGFAELVSGSLEALASEWPAPADADEVGTEAAEIAQARGTVEIYEAAGAARMIHGGGANWTVVFESDLVAVPPLPGRSVRIRPVDDLTEVAAILGPAGRHLQSVGYAGAEERITGLAESLGRAGASRVVPFARVSFPPAWWLHDGKGPLETLVRWVEVE